MTPLRLLELFFDDVLADMIFGYTKLHSPGEKTGTIVEELGGGGEEGCILTVFKGNL